MENLKSTDPIYLEKKYGWCTDIYMGEKSSFKTDVCTVWGSTEEELNHRATMIKKSSEMLEALKRQFNGNIVVIQYSRDAKLIENAIKLNEEIDSLINELES